MKPGWHKIAARLTRGDVLVNMVTNGMYRTGAGASEIARRATAAGMCNIGISIDGTESIHEMIRGEGTYAQTMKSIGTFVEAGIKVGVLTTVNRLNFPYLDQIRRSAMDSGATMWRIQIAKPMGEMKENDDWVLTPAQYMELVTLLARFKRTPGINLAIGDSIGYYGRPDRILRNTGWRGRKESWQGCQAGMRALGIEADGGIKGCLSLQAKWGDSDPFVEGNVRETPLTELWYKPGVFAFNRDHDPESLQGFCATCKHGALCRGGAKCVASSFMGHIHEDPYCYYRLQSILNGNQEGAFGKTAAAAAAALVISLGIQGCPSSEADYGVPADIGNNDASRQADIMIPDSVEEDEFAAPEYGIFPDMVPQPDAQLDYGIPPDVVEPDAQLEYGMPPDIVEPDAQMDYGIIPDVVEPDAQLEYGMPPDVVEPEVQMDYGIEPDVVDKDAINCDDVCCECEYGVIPDEVWKECCDPCKDACCDCDYGEPPPPECCD